MCEQHSKSNFKILTSLLATKSTVQKEYTADFQKFYPAATLVGINIKILKSLLTAKLNLLRKMTVELTFEKFLPEQHSSGYSRAQVK